MSGTHKQTRVYTIQQEWCVSGSVEQNVQFGATPCAGVLVQADQMQYYNDEAIIAFINTPVKDL